MADIDALLDEVERFDPESEDDDTPTCAHCGDTYLLRDGATKTPLCDTCAHEAVSALAAEVRRLRECVATEAHHRMQAEGDVRAVQANERTALEQVAHWRRCYEQAVEYGRAAAYEANEKGGE